MKVLFFFSLLFSASVFAISNENLSTTCLQRGKEKIQNQADAWGCMVDLDKVVVEDVDNRWWNPLKYVWYQVSGECNGNDRIIKIVTYSDGKCL